MTCWRLCVGALVVVLVGAPLALPLLDLCGRPSAWRAWSDADRLLLLAGSTVRLVAGVLLVALPPGIAGAFLLYRTDLPLRRAFRFLTVLTLFVPLPLFASGWQAALGTGGWLPVSAWSTPAPNDPDVTATGLGWKPWAQGVGAAVLIHAAAGLPWVVLLVGLGLRWVERELEEDALTAAGSWRVAWCVTLPRSLPAVSAAGLWVALQAATEITVTDMVQLRTYAEEVYYQLARPELDPAVPDLRDKAAAAVAVSLPFVVLTWLVVVAAARSWARSLPTPATLAAPPRDFALGRLRWPCFLVTSAAAAVLFGVPVASLLWKAGLSGSPEAWSATYAVREFAGEAQVHGRLVVNSLLLAVAAGFLTAGLGLVACWQAAESPAVRAAGLGLVAAAWALPAPVAGLGLMDAIDYLLALFGSRPGNPVAVALWYGPSPLPALWAYLVRFFPFAVAVLWPAVRLVPAELRDAARVDGARPGQELRHVVLPLTAPAWARAGLAVAVLSLGELGASKLLGTPGSQTFAHQLFSQMHYSVTSKVAALCLVLLSVVTVGGILFALLTVRLTCSRAPLARRGYTSSDPGRR